eukprot:SAG31_NODE_42440_length_271_cov_1.261628_1_plen_27_part_10
MLVQMAQLKFYFYVHTENLPGNVGLVA